MDYYEILGVSKDATPQEIKKAFRQVARECHPDVTKDDPKLAERFKDARKAYEVLIDPVARGQYDRRGERRVYERGSFFNAFYRHTGQKPPNEPPKPKTRTSSGFVNQTPNPRRQAQHPNNDLSLDDLFNDFGFGAQKPKGATPKTPPPLKPQLGHDVQVILKVDAKIAHKGGTVTLHYTRLQRSDRWQPGSDEPSTIRINEIADIRIIPGTSDGEVLTERGLGDAGQYGGSYGDLLVTVRVIASEAEEAQSNPRDTKPREEANGRSEAPSPALIQISVVEALLGGRIEVDTPKGRVRISLSPGTSSGATMRLKGKGEDIDGVSQDFYITIRIVVPKSLDDQSRKLIEEFARLNPGTPRD